MAIDSSLWAIDIPAGEYAVGDVVELKCIDGPANVRSGRGSAILKTIFVGQFQSNVFWRIHVRNSDWIDEVVSFTSPINYATIFDPEAGPTQNCHDCPLTPNSSWQIYAECVSAGTLSAADSLFALIDVDYPSVSAVQNPRLAQGVPVSIPYDVTDVDVKAYGNMLNSMWKVESVDYFKAGFRYVLDTIEVVPKGITFGFVAFSNAAGMGGLQRIIPFTHRVEGVRFPIFYSSPLVKGPMDVKIKGFSTSASTGSATFCHDYVRRPNV